MKLEDKQLLKTIYDIAETFLQARTMVVNDGTVLQEANIVDAIYHLSKSVSRLADTMTSHGRVEELVDAAEKVYAFKDVMTTDGPHALILALAMIDLHKAVERIKQGSSPAPVAGQNPEHSA